MPFHCDYNQLRKKTQWINYGVVCFEGAVREIIYPEVVELLYVSITLPLALLRPISALHP